MAIPEKSDTKLELDSGLMRQILDSSRDMLLCKDLDGRIIYCNPLFAKYKKVDTPETLIGKFDYEISENFDFEKAKESREKIIRGQKSIGMCIIESHIGKTTRFFHFSCKAVYNNNKQVVAILETYKDITESHIRRLESEKQSQLVLAVNYALRTIFSAEGVNFSIAMKQGLKLLTSATGASSGAFIFYELTDQALNNSNEIIWPDTFIAGPYAKAMIEILKHQPQTRSLLLSAKDTNSSIQKHMLRVGLKSILVLPLRAEGKLLSSFMFFSQNPTEEWNNSVINLLKIGAEMLALHLQNSHNLSLIKRSGEQLTRALSLAKNSEQAAMRANKAKSKFLANMSHEIRTPMNAILGFAEILEREINDIEQQQQLGVISQSAKGLLSLLNDLLDFSRMEAGMIKLELGEFDLNESVSQICKMMLETASRKGVTLCNNTLATDTLLLTDGSRIRQILINLISNALKFTDKGSVTISAQQQIIDKKADLTISVTDTGRGIPDQKLNEIFEMFTQVETSDASQHNGAGLGLSISLHLAKLLGGEISVSSTEGVGSTFTLALSGLEVINDNNENLSNTFRDKTFADINTIIAYNELIDYSLMTKRLSLLGITDIKDGTEDPSNLYSLVAEYKPRLLIVPKSIVLTGLINTLRANYKEDESLSDMIVFTTSSSNSRVEIEKLKTLGCNQVLIKPIEMITLSDELEKYFPVISNAAENTDNQTSINTIPQDIADNLFNQIKDNWFEVSATLIFDDIINFAENIEALANNAEAPEVAAWARVLSTQAKSFDMRHLPETLAELPIILKQQQDKS